MSASSPTPSGGGLYTHPQSTSTSSFVLLTTERSPLLSSPSSASSPLRPLAPSLPRPRLTWLLQLFCIADLTLVLLAGLAVPLSTLPKSALALSLLRPVVVFAVVSSQRVRQRGVIIIAQVLVSFLILLYRLNERVQTSSPSPPSSPPPREDTPGSKDDDDPLPPFLRSPTTRWYLLSFALSLAHYALFACVVGVRRQRNPLAGRRDGAWGETEWEGREESVAGLGECEALAGGRRPRVRGRTVSRASRLSLTGGGAASASSAAGSSTAGAGGAGVSPASIGGEEDDAELGEEVLEEEDAPSLSPSTSDEEDALLGLDDPLPSSSEDEDDIIDIPRPYSALGGGGGAGGGGSGELRHRASRASLLSTRTWARVGEEGRSPPNPSSGEEGRPTTGLRASRGFGSTRSLGSRLCGPAS
ncbi:hypothetical protein JCM8097_009314 [Rhodosporidiobolus ruineniae]